MKGNTSYKTYLRSHQLAKQFGTFDPFKIASGLGYHVRYADIGKLQGLCTTSYLGDVYIALSDKIRELPTRYTVLAHELDHGLDHTDCVALYTVSNQLQNKMEYQANAFACSDLTALYQEQYGERPDSFKDLQLAYGVPQEFFDLFFN
ncbi:ImmA/IrrE family metallo-endopeptidase [Lactiplantibacillus daowaiensis]|uniref:ImmA/IrrE family metallo-endopeptidase n=1 Tax=Lactiplantibacillus daowaiensis TaxID=2559918 RepID=A0ABW1RY02_9LACO|nr:hypothetical protein [Lactiplantibacillus daowaiensis]